MPSVRSSRRTSGWTSLLLSATSSSHAACSMVRARACPHSSDKHKIPTAMWTSLTVAATRRKQNDTGQQKQVRLSLNLSIALSSILTLCAHLDAQNAQQARARRNQEDGDDSGAVDDPDVLAEVVLARTPGMSITTSCSDPLGSRNNYVQSAICQDVWKISPRTLDTPPYRPSFAISCMSNCRPTRT